MIKFKIAKKENTKTYLAYFNTFKFDNLLHLLFELFNNNDLTNNKPDDILYEHILSLGYEDVTQIPEKIKKELESWYFELLDKYNKDFDNEKEIYLLMAKIANDQLLVIIDNQPIDIKQSVKLNKNSVISFIDRQKINDIRFTTI